MATPDYSINYDDRRFAEVEADKKAALSEVDVTYGDMISDADKYFDEQIDAAQDYADKQSQIQQEQTDFAIEQIEQQKADAKKDYIKEQSGAFVDWKKQSNQYGANAERQAAQGMQNTGFSESSQVSMYNAYQNRVATARESYNRIVADYNNAITEARLQNNAALAEIAYNALQKKLELSLQGFQYKNELLIAQSDKKLALESEYHQRYQDVLAQINQENALAENVRQHNEQMAEERRQFDANLALDREQFEWQKAQAAAKTSGGGGKTSTKSNATIKKSSGNTGGAVKKAATSATKAVSKAKESESEKLTYTDLAYTAAQMRAKGAEKNDIYQYLSGVINSSNYKPTTSKAQDLKELKSGYVGVGR